MTIDNRLLDCASRQEIEANMNRILGIVDDNKTSTDATANVMNDFVQSLLKHVFVVGTEAELIAALADTLRSVSYVTADITLTGQLTIAQAFRLYGQDKDITDDTLDATQYMALQIAFAGVTIQDLTFAISGDSDGNAIYSIDVGAAGSTIMNCTFTMANAGSSGAVSIYYEGYADHVLKDNTFSNGVALTGGASFDEISGNTFAATKGFGLGECTINGIHYFEADPDKVADITAYLVAEGNTTTGGDLVVEGYFEEA
jgi:hypothetical protein